MQAAISLNVLERIKLEHIDSMDLTNFVSSSMFPFIMNWEKIENIVLMSPSVCSLCWWTIRFRPNNPDCKKKIHKNAKAIKMVVYLLLISTCLLIPIPKEQKTSTLVHFFLWSRVWGDFFIFKFFVTVEMRGRRIKFWLYRKTVRSLDDEGISDISLTRERMCIF
jgi:hypothetical protein